MEWVLNIFIFTIFASLFLTTILNVEKEVEESEIKSIKESCEYIYKELTKYDLKQYIPKIKKIEEDIIQIINNHKNTKYQELEKLKHKIDSIKEQITIFENNYSLGKQYIKDFIKSFLDIYITSS